MPDFVGTAQWSWSMEPMARAPPPPPILGLYCPLPPRQSKVRLAKGCVGTGAGASDGSGWSLPGPPPPPPPHKGSGANLHRAHGRPCHAMSPAPAHTLKRCNLLSVPAPRGVHVVKAPWRGAGRQNKCAMVTYASERTGSGSSQWTAWSTRSVFRRIRAHDLPARWTCVPRLKKCSPSVTHTFLHCFPITSNQSPVCIL